MEEISTDDAPPRIGPFSQVLRDGDTVYVSDLPVDIRVEIEAVASVDQ